MKTCKISSVHVATSQSVGLSDFRFEYITTRRAKSLHAVYVGLSDSDTAVLYMVNSSADATFALPPIRPLIDNSAFPSKRKRKPHIIPPHNREKLQ